MKRTMLIAALVILPGCSVAPTVTYSVIEDGHPLSGREFDSYFLQASNIHIALPATPAAKAANGVAPQQSANSDPQITSVPTENPGLKLGLVHADQVGVTSTVNMTKLPDTDLVSAVATTTTDQRVALVTALGGLVVGGLKLTHAGASSVPVLDMTVLPIDIAMTPDLINKAANPNGFSPQDGVTITVLALPPDAVAFDRKNFPKTSGGYLYAACRPAKITIAYNPDASHVKIVTATIKIADPAYLQQVAFPVAGSITMHPGCGVSVAATSGSSATAFVDIAKAFADQAVAIQGSIAAAAKANK